MNFLSVQRVIQGRTSGEREKRFVSCPAGSKVHGHPLWKMTIPFLSRLTAASSVQVTLSNPFLLLHLLREEKKAALSV